MIFTRRGHDGIIMVHVFPGHDLSPHEVATALPDHIGEYGSLLSGNRGEATSILSWRWKPGQPCLSSWNILSGTETDMEVAHRLVEEGWATSFEVVGRSGLASRRISVMAWTERSTEIRSVHYLDDRDGSVTVRAQDFLRPEVVERIGALRAEISTTRLGAWLSASVPEGEVRDNIREADAPVRFRKDPPPGFVFFARRTTTCGNERVLVGRPRPDGTLHVPADLMGLCIGRAGANVKSASQQFGRQLKLERR